MVWVLMLIAVEADMFYIRGMGIHNSMDSCFRARQALVEEIGRPIVNYQTLCIQTDQLKGI